jgi:KipI family sensor histidine kinase inhibitor
MRIHRYGADALLVEVDDTAQAPALYHEALTRTRAGKLDVRDLVPGARTLLLDGVDDPDAVARDVETWRPQALDSRAGRSVEVPTRYDGADVDAVARIWGMTAEEVVATHTGTAFVVAFCGFSPGFAYCTGLPADLAVPRHDTPRSQVPAGSVGLAGEFTGIYPTASPGGWQLLGTTDLALWDADREQPATLPPGTRVRFVRA